MPYGRMSQNGLGSTERRVRAPSPEPRHRADQTALALLAAPLRSSRRGRRGHPVTASLTEPLLSRAVSEGGHRSSGRPGRKFAFRSLLDARASEDPGVNVERPQPEARTNDVDARDDWRRILTGNLGALLPQEGDKGHSGTVHQAQTSGRAGRAEPAAGHLFAPLKGAWWGAATARRVQSLSDHATMMGSCR